MKKVIALVAFTAFLSVNTFAQDAKVASDKKESPATEKSSCCVKPNASCCKTTKKLKLAHLNKKHLALKQVNHVLMMLLNLEQT
ncbi:MAG: hypothetical protein IPI10_00330 [Bacteroidetes bacterium]|nr:hypothetical protein [Bacteroidota bacterium]